MSGIVGGINLRSSGLVNNSSATDGQILTGTGAGLPAGFEAAAGGGKCLQVVQTIKADIFTTTTLGSWHDLTDMTVTTGSLATTSSRVMLIGSVQLAHPSESGYWKICLGDGSDITDFVGDARGSRVRSTGGNAYSYHSYKRHSESVTLIHSPGSTSAQTYKIQVWCHNASPLYCNKSHTDSDSAEASTGVSSITAMEIGE